MCGNTLCLALKEDGLFVSEVMFITNAIRLYHAKQAQLLITYSGILFMLFETASSILKLLFSSIDTPLIVVGSHSRTVHICVFLYQRHTNLT